MSMLKRAIDGLWDLARVALSPLKSTGCRGVLARLLGNGSLQICPVPAVYLPSWLPAMQAARRRWDEAECARSQ